jgi:hypothetical protein
MAILMTRDELEARVAHLEELVGALLDSNFSELAAAIEAETFVEVLFEQLLAMPEEPETIPREDLERARSRFRVRMDVLAHKDEMDVDLFSTMVNALASVERPSQEEEADDDD